MRIYKLKLDVDNYKTCFIEGTNVSKDCFDNLCTATSLDFEYETVRFRYSDKDDKKRGDVLHCWDFCGYLINDKLYSLLSSKRTIKAQYIKLQENIILINNLFVIDCLDNEKTKYEYFEKDIIGVEKYSFKRLDYPPLFQITLPNGYVELFYFVTDEFIKIINDNNIKGFLFEEVWDSEKVKSGGEDE